MQAKLYLSIIDDVIESMRELFLDEGLEDRVLDDLRHVSYIRRNPAKIHKMHILTQVTAKLGHLVRKYTCYQEDRLLCPLLCSFGSQRWCSQKQWKTWGKTTTHPTLCCSSLPTTDRLIKRSQVTLCHLKQTAFDKASISNYIASNAACQTEFTLDVPWMELFLADDTVVIRGACSTLIFAFSISCDPHESEYPQFLKAQGKCWKIFYSTSPPWPHIALYIMHHNLDLKSSWIFIFVILTTVHYTSLRNT